jgi:hypothetical protein
MEDILSNPAALIVAAYLAYWLLREIYRTCVIIAWRLRIVPASRQRARRQLRRHAGPMAVPMVNQSKIHSKPWPSR